MAEIFDLFLQSDIKLNVKQFCGIALENLIKFVNLFPGVNKISHLL